MRGIWSRHLLRALILAAAFFCWYHALILSGDMVKAASTVSFRYVSDGIPYSTVDRMLEEESVPFAVWVQKNNQRVKEQDFSRDTCLRVLEIAGDAKLVLPQEELLYGFLPVRESMNTCAIDAATAYTLWCGTDVIGETLIYDNKEYTVTGVFSRPENTMLLQSRIEKDIMFPYLELLVSDMNTARRQADEFRAHYSLPEPDMLTDHAESAAMLRQLAMLPALFVVAMLLRRVLRQCFRKSVSTLGRAGFAITMLAGILILAWAIGFFPVIPAAAIPSRWSDFSFWSGYIEQISKQLRLSRALSWPAPDLLRLQGRHYLLLYSGKALAGFVIGLLWDSEKRGGERQDGVYNAEKYL